jgi:hypothetical protein
MEIQSSLDLIRKAVNNRRWEEIVDPLDLAEVSCHSLSNILNDMLDFGKKDWAKQKTKVVDLAISTREIVTMCMATHKHSTGVGGQVIIDLENRDWKATIDEARFHR